MGRETLINKLKSLQTGKILRAGGIALAVVAVIVVAVKTGPTIAKQGKLVAHAGWQKWSFARVIDRYADAVASVQDKINALSQADQENQRLKLENTHLRLMVENLQFEQKAKDSSEKTLAYGRRLASETGSKTGLKDGALDYQIPTQLLPPQLYTLGVSYFKGHEDEKAAKIFAFLTTLEENDSYKTSQTYLMSGISWYRLDNYEQADSYFDRVLKTPESPDTLQYQAQARLWKALTAQRLNKQLKAQFWLRELVDHHPKSMEASWVNPLAQEAKRVPASTPAAQTHHKAH